MNNGNSNNTNIIDELKKQGYTDEEIQLAIENLSRLDISQGELQEGRDDRTVIVTDQQGNIKRTSSIMLGYNKTPIRLDNGEYVSWEEIEKTLTDSLSVDGEDVVYVSKKTGKKVDTAELIEGLFASVTENSSYISQRPSNVFPNQDARQIVINDDGREYYNGIFMYGNGLLNLPNGAYISRAEFEAALAEYIKMVPGKTPPVVPPIPPIVSDPTNPEPVYPDPTNPNPNPPEFTPLNPEETYTVIKRFSKRPLAVPIITMATAALLALSGLGKEPVMSQTEVITPQDNLSYSMTALEEKEVTEPVFRVETEAERRERLLANSEVGIGDTQYMPDGTTYYASSDYDLGGPTDSGTFYYADSLDDSRIGESYSNGDYEVSVLSVISVNNDGSYSVYRSDGETTTVGRSGTEAYMGEEREEVHLDDGRTITNLGELATYVKEINPNSEIFARAHVVDDKGDNIGWVDMSVDWLNQGNMDINPQEVVDHYITSVVIDESQEQRGTIEGFEGDQIQISNNGEDVILPVKDESGQFLENGSIVVGNDGQSYRLDLEVEHEEIIDYETEKTGEKITWSIHNIDLEDAMATAAITAAALALGMRKKKEMVDMTASEIGDLTAEARDKYREKLGDFAGDSSFAHAVEDIVTRKVADDIRDKNPFISSEGLLGQALIDQDITVEDIENMGNEIKGGSKK